MVNFISVECRTFEDGRQFCDLKMVGEEKERELERERERERTTTVTTITISACDEHTMTMSLVFLMSTADKLVLDFR